MDTRRILAVFVCCVFFFFFFNDTATTEIYTLSYTTLFRSERPLKPRTMRDKDGFLVGWGMGTDRKSTRLNSSHQIISYAVFCLKKKNKHIEVLPSNQIQQQIERPLNGFKKNFKRIGRNIEIARQLKERLAVYFFFFNDTATTEIYTLSLHDALPICDAKPAKEATAPKQKRTKTSTRK